MTISERLDNVRGSIEIRTVAGPWMELTVWYRASREAYLEQARIQISSLTNLENVVSVALDEIEAALGIYQPETIEA